ncbi:uncharacterized protein I206_103928 [Kwoniella pini CBS 10737]|uniref:Uncharacterized protein n=1 Tax=Kwoniella pini CBS 10737 TaxID=1296096 RepID=A0A1B9I3B7_9TREE|nr:uncharacterized protein I206_04499 [Kwoniella pini CBS 10737]OCF49968.1 hypothetical protein I206_04499 [Kwoniella pini CBS 10737]
MSSLADDEFGDIVKISPPTTSTPLFPSHNDENGFNSQLNAAMDSNESNSAAAVSEIPKEVDTKYDIKPIIKPSSGEGPISILKTSSSPSTPIKKEIKLVIKQDKLPEQAHQDMNGVFDDTVKKVKIQSDKLQTAAQPYADKTRNFAESRPVLFTFIALWAAFSAIPIFIFLGFALITTLVIMSTAIFFSALIIIGAVLMGGGALIGTLLFGVALLVPIIFITTFLAVGSLTTLLGLFLVHRLYLNIANAAVQEGWTANAIISGIKAWIEETSIRIRSSSPFRKSSSIIGNDKKSKHGHKHHHKLGSSGPNNASTVISTAPREKLQGFGTLEENKTDDQFNIRDEKVKPHEYEGDQQDIQSQASTSTASSRTSHGTALSEKIGHGNIEGIPKLGDLSEKSSHEV